MHVLTRNPKPNSSKNIQFFKWDMDRGFIDEKVFEGVTVIINLTGANIGEKRWTAQRFGAWRQWWTRAQRTDEVN